MLLPGVFLTDLSNPATVRGFIMHADERIVWLAVATSIREQSGVSQETASGLAARALMYVSHHGNFLAHMDLRSSERQEFSRGIEVLILTRHHQKS